MTAAAATTAATAASQQLSLSAETPGVPRAGTKYPVRENPSLRYFQLLLLIFNESQSKYMIWGVWTCFLGVRTYILCSGLVFYVSGLIFWVIELIFWVLDLYF